MSFYRVIIAGSALLFVGALAALVLLEEKNPYQEFFDNPKIKKPIPFYPLKQKIEKEFFHSPH